MVWQKEITALTAKIREAVTSETREDALRHLQTAAKHLKKAIEELEDE